MITVDNLENTKATIDNLMERGQSLFADIRETAQDRARLLSEAEEREKVIERLNREADETSAQVNDLTARNGRLADDVDRLESALADATARLDTILETANRAPQQRTPPGGTANGANTQSLTSMLDKLRHMPRGQGLLPRADTRERDDGSRN